MDLVTELFGFLCGRGQCFAVDGAALPVCQRCLGLYVGAALTAAWVLVARLWRRGLPPGALLASHVLVLAGAILGGVHVLDFGPLWRLVCGLATGHILLLWLVMGAAHLWRAGRQTVAPPQPWRRIDRAIALAVVVLLVAAGAVSAAGPGRLLLGGHAGPGDGHPGAMLSLWGLWTVLSAVGAAALAIAAVCALASVMWLIRGIWRGRRRGPDEVRP